ncbi:MAG TPA: pirin family protein [Myxococcaceae bacterium]|nr:pirin family protein [Myxococcaceae bacterium]
MIELILDPRHLNFGGGFEVDRVLPAKRRTLGPFVLLDHGGPQEHPPGEGFGILPHPHIGISTLTYVFAGEMIHRDSLGNTTPIRPGEVNLMTAGRGIVHSERASPAFVASGGSLHVLQLWVGLTAAHEEVEPSFQHLDQDELPRIQEAGASARLIGGTAYGLTSPLRTFTPQFYVELRLEAGASFPLPVGHEERGAYVVTGHIESEGREIGERHLAFFAPEGTPTIRAEMPSIVMLLGGARIAPPRMWWNFVSTRLERIEQAKRDWALGRFVLPPDDKNEWIPLPGEPAPHPEPMS